jgi:ubiquinol-cytochrome c reductase cytochrome b subunit
MSFWGATVITSLASAIPIVGDEITHWLWGGFSVDNATLNRFFSLHYLVPFLIAGVVLIHLSLLHTSGSNNPLGINSNIDLISFYPYFYVKDLFAFLIFICFFSLFVFFAPNILGHSDNYIPANPLVTPPHIVPEWYFLPFYAVLRSIPDKLGGVVAMISAILVLLIIPVINFSQIRSSKFRPLYSFFYWFLFADFILLGWIGQKPVESPYIEIGMFATLFYFMFFLLLMPIIGISESFLIFNDIKTDEELEAEINSKFKVIASEQNTDNAFFLGVDDNNLDEEDQYDSYNMLLMIKDEAKSIRVLPPLYSLPL